MALAQGKQRAKKERRAIYFDIICGIVSSIISLSGITYVAILNLVVNIGWFTVGLTFWVGYLIFSISILLYLIINRKNINLNNSLSFKL